MELGVVDDDVVALPKTVLGSNLRMVNLHVLTVLEHIFCVAHQSIHIDVL